MAYAGEDAIELANDMEEDQWLSDILHDNINGDTNSHDAVHSIMQTALTVYAITITLSPIVFISKNIKTKGRDLIGVINIIAIHYNMYICCS